MINMPWSADGYGPLDFTLLDRHRKSISLSTTVMINLKRMLTSISKTVILRNGAP